MPSHLIQNNLAAAILPGDITLTKDNFSEHAGQLIPVESIVLNFGLNRVPQAVISVGLGREIHTGEFSQVYKLLRRFYQDRETVSVHLYVTGPWEPSETRKKSDKKQQGQKKDKDKSKNKQGGPRWESSGPQKIFVGQCVGLNCVRSFGQIAIVLHLVHWLADLSVGSTLSEQSHPQNPFDLAFRAVRGAAGTGLDRLPAFLENVYNVVSEGSLEADVWGESLLKMFESLAEEDHIRLGDASDCGGVAQSNRLSKQVLKKLRNSLKHPKYQPAKLHQEAAKEGLAKGILQYIQRNLTEPFWQTTFWDLLVGEFCPKLLLQVVPLVEDALVVPACPLLKKVYKDLKPEDITFMNPVLFQQRPLRAVGLWSNVTSETNYAGQTPDVQNIGACWMPDPKVVGLVRYLPAPEWLHHIPAVTQDPQKSLPDGAKRISTAITPQSADQNSGGGQDRNKTMREVRNDLEEVARRLAQHYYGLEVLQGRSLICHGKLRFDIAPGSIVRLRDLSPIPGTRDLIGLVELVSVTISSTQRQAMTTLHLSHIRTSEENDVSKLTMDKHPIYDTDFCGAPLVKAWEFPRKS